MAFLSNYQALLFDIDRTLTPPTGEIFPEIVEMLKQLHAKRIAIGLCSGRGFASISNKFTPLFPEDSLHILAGGALVITNSGLVKWEQSIDPDTIDQLLALIRNTKSKSIFTKPDAQYSEGEVLDNIRKHPWNQVCKDLKTMTRDGVNLVYVARPNEQLKSHLENHPKLSFKDLVSNDGFQYFDITAKGVNKAKAVEEWSKITNIPTSKIIGFGDSVNDLEFLQSCGFAVAMGNAQREIKQIANRVIGEVTQKGLPNYVQNILKGNPL